jgi:hypothetical protein
MYLISEMNALDKGVSVKKNKRTVYFDDKRNQMLDKIYGIFLATGRKKTYNDIMQDALIHYYSLLRKPIRMRTKVVKKRVEKDFK